MLQLQRWVVLLFERVQHMPDMRCWNIFTGAGILLYEVQSWGVRGQYRGVHVHGVRRWHLDRRSGGDSMSALPHRDIFRNDRRGPKLYVPEMPQRDLLDTSWGQHLSGMCGVRSRKVFKHRRQQLYTVRTQHVQLRVLWVMHWMSAVL